MTKFPRYHHVPIVPITQVAANGAVKGRRKVRLKHKNMTKEELEEFAKSIICDETLSRECITQFWVPDEAPLPKLPMTYDRPLNRSISEIDARIEKNNSLPLPTQIVTPIHERVPTASMYRMPVLQDMIPVPEAMLE
tara:strand:+ start:641 stop:1051 length:411 start_codon:yes stop_codon:yes gene_type:complete